MKFFNKNLQVQKLCLPLQRQNNSKRNESCHFSMAFFMPLLTYGCIISFFFCACAWDCFDEREMYSRFFCTKSQNNPKMDTNPTANNNVAQNLFFDEAGLTDFQFLTLMEKGGEV